MRKPKVMLYYKTNQLQIEAKKLLLDNVEYIRDELWESMDESILLLTEFGQFANIIGVKYFIDNVLERWEESQKLVDKKI